MLDKGDLPEISVELLEFVSRELLLNFPASSRILVDVIRVLPRFDQIYRFLVLVEVSDGTYQFGCVCLLRLETADFILNGHFENVVRRDESIFGHLNTIQRSALLENIQLWTGRSLALILKSVCSCHMLYLWLYDA